MTKASFKEKLRSKKATAGITLGARIALLSAIALLVVVLDQVSKAWMRLVLVRGDLPLIPGVLRLSLVENTGAALSIGQGATWLFIATAMGIIFCAYLWVINDKNLPLSIVVSLGVICGGGAGNLIDRLVRGSVTDFFATEFIKFPIFNVADIAISLGIFVAFILIWRYDRRDDQRCDRTTK